jgi:RHS repeat-associated protein
LDFEARFTRDSFGFELERAFPGGVSSRWQRDNLGRPLKQELWARERWSGERQYQWEVRDRLKSIVDTSTGPVRYRHDAVGTLTAAVYDDGHVELRLPDAVGNLFRSERRDDRKYGPAGQLLETKGPSGTVRFDYDAEGNLVKKTEADGRAWQYQWDATGMLAKVVRPDGFVVEMRYDALGRRVSKSYGGKVTRWIWNGNQPIHEWVEAEPGSQARQPEAPGLESVLSAQRQALLQTRSAQGPPEGAASRGTREEPITWLFEPGTFVPVGKLVGEEHFGIVADPLGVPIRMYDRTGREVWSAELGIYGELRNVRGERQACPFRWPGQYDDEETGLYYNRFRYYDPRAGQYVSQDPIELAGGFELYAYVRDPLSWIDPLGLTGVVYLRTDPVTGEEYVGQAKSPAHYRARQNAHNRAARKATGNPGFKYDFDELEKNVTPGVLLDRAEEDWIRAGGGPKTGLENKRHQMADKRYKAAGGCVP